MPDCTPFTQFRIRSEVSKGSHLTLSSTRIDHSLTPAYSVIPTMTRHHSHPTNGNSDDLPSLGRRSVTEAARLNDAPKPARIKITEKPKPQRPRLWHCVSWDRAFNESSEDAQYTRLSPRIAKSPEPQPTLRRSSRIAARNSADKSLANEVAKTETEMSKADGAYEPGKISKRGIPRTVHTETVQGTHGRASYWFWKSEQRHHKG